MKPGVNSSEFWMGIIYIAAMLANGTQFFNIPWDQMAIAAGVVGVYTAGRSFVKGRAP